MRIITFANQKGGVAKTTSAVNVAVGLALRGYSVLLVDMDPQANATYSILGAYQPERTIYDLLIRDDALATVSLSTRTDKLKLLPSGIDLAGAEIELVSQPGGQTLLRTKLRGAGYDFIVIDAPPSLGLLTLNALATATEVLIPVGVGVFALKGLAQLEQTIAKVRDRLDRPDLKIGGVFVTMADTTNVCKDVTEAIHKRYGPVAFKTSIPRSIRTEEAHSRGQSVLEYAPESSGAIAYNQLIEEIIQRG
jgi:chromosome partitioning protein